MLVVDYPLQISKWKSISSIRGLPIGELPIMVSNLVDADLGFLSIAHRRVILFSKLTVSLRKP